MTFLVLHCVGVTALQTVKTITRFGIFTFEKKTKSGDFWPFSRFSPPNRKEVRISECRAVYETAVCGLSCGPSNRVKEKSDTFPNLSCVLGGGARRLNFCAWSWLSSLVKLWQLGTNATQTPQFQPIQSECNNAVPTPSIMRPSHCTFFSLLQFPPLANVMHRCGPKTETIFYYAVFICPEKRT